MLQDLAPASFRGAAFLCPKDTAQEGRNVIEHKYPDSNRRYAEDNGYCPPEFTLTCVLHGNDVLSKFKSLRAALNRPGPGTLRHPWYGSQLCAVKGPWKVTREDTDLGVLTLEVTFLVTGNAIFPMAMAAIPAMVSSLSAGLVSTAMAGMASAYGKPQMSAYTIERAARWATETANAFADLAAAPDVALGIDHLSDDPDLYVVDGTALAGQLTLLARGAFEDDTYSGEEIVRALRRVNGVLEGVRAEGLATPTTTLDYLTRRHLALTYSTYCRIVTLSSMAEAMAGTTYISADAVQASETLLLDIYADLDMDQVDATTAQALAEVVAAAMDVLRQQEMQLPRISEQALFAPLPASVLAYMLYESEERTDTIVALNMTSNPILIERAANVLLGAA